MPFDDLLSFAKALANENRQAILFEVFSDKQPHSVNEVAARMGLAQSTTSEHLTALRRAGVLKAEKVERQVLYRVDKAAIETVIAQLRQWLTCC